MSILRLDVLASCLNLAGGFVLALDALRARGAAQARRGGQKLLGAVLRFGKSGKSLADDAGRELGTEAELEDLSAEATLRAARIGFTLLVLGFLLDLAVKLSHP